MKLYALSDLHIGRPDNLRAIQAIEERPDDWLILAGDVGDTEDELKRVFDMVRPKFSRVLWVPGNHELWVTGEGLRGEALYERLVEVCRASDVLTPEDPYPLWNGEGGPCVVVPLFLLYDYTFGPDGLNREQAIAWAREANILCVDERRLKPVPHRTIADWCHDRVAKTEARLEQLPKDLPTVLINHYPLRQEHAYLPRVPRFSIWCGTRLTNDWHRRYRAKVVVYGHLHFRSTRYLDGVRFEEVSLGYPKQWMQGRGADGYVREILPGPAPDPSAPAFQYHR